MCIGYSNGEYCSLSMHVIQQAHHGLIFSRAGASSTPTYDKCISQDGGKPNPYL